MAVRRRSSHREGRCRVPLPATLAYPVRLTSQAAVVRRRSRLDDA